MNSNPRNRIEAHQAACSPMTSAPKSNSEGLPFRETGYGSTTHGVLGYKRVSGEADAEVGPFDLEARLAALCDKLRARY
jgi:hypothetical protein